MNKPYSDFIEIMGEPIHSTKAPEDIIEKYSKVIMGPDDEVDIITEMWKEFGLDSIPLLSTSISPSVLIALLTKRDIVPMT